MRKPVRARAADAYSSFSRDIMTRPFFRLGATARTDVDVHVLDRRRVLVRDALPPEMIAAHREHAGDVTRAIRIRAIDQRHDDALPFVVLIPEGGVPAVAVDVHAQISVISDRADDITRLVDAAGHDAMR